MTEYDIAETIASGPLVVNTENPSRTYENYFIDTKMFPTQTPGVTFPLFLAGTLSVAGIAAALAPVAIEAAANYLKK